MYAVLEIAGKQYKVENDKYLYVDKLEGAEGDKVNFDKVLLVDNNGDVKVGAPTVGTGPKITVVFAPACPGVPVVVTPVV